MPRKRTNAEREEQLISIAKMHLERMSQRQIGAALGLTHQQICHDLKEIYRRWAEPTKESLTFYRERMLAKIEFHEHKANELLQKSLADYEKNEVSQRTVPTGGDGAAQDKEILFRRRVTESQSGNPAYMRSLEWCMEQEIKIRGLAAPQKTEVTGESGKPLEFIEVIKTVVLGAATTTPEAATTSPPIDDEPDEPLPEVGPRIE